MPTSSRSPLVVVAFAPTREADGTGWILATDHQMDWTDLEITRFAPDGTRAWTVGLGVAPESESSYEAAIETTDLEGDGTEEILVFAGATSSLGDWMDDGRQIFMIVEADGTVRVRREVELDGFGHMRVLPAGGGRPARVVLIGISRMATVDTGM